ncbi:hypothetical protein HYE40_02885 [Mycoplasmopsis bovis]|nr:hypothetical protein [Mycoplasmopsis bovis]QQH20924.1 hypothetical protein HYE40_02885 [Mycoplasmopsis bovis]
MLNIHHKTRIKVYRYLQIIDGILKSDNSVEVIDQWLKGRLNLAKILRYFTLVTYIPEANLSQIIPRKYAIRVEILEKTYWENADQWAKEYADNYRALEQTREMWSSFYNYR